MEPCVYIGDVRAGSDPEPMGDRELGGRPGDSPMTWRSARGLIGLGCMIGRSGDDATSEEGMGRWGRQ